MTAISWVVQAGDGESVADVVARIPGAEGGRLFLNGRPAALDEAVELGDRVDIHPGASPRRAPSSFSRSAMGWSS